MPLHRPSVQRYGSRHVTPATRSRPSSGGAAFAAATSAAASCCFGSVETTPFWKPSRTIRRTSARVSMPGDARHVPATQEGVERLLRAPVARHVAELLHDEGRQIRPRRLVVLGIHADVPDLRVGHRHDLPGVGRIRQDLLVAGHARVEADLAARDALRAEGGAPVHGAVGERERRRAREGSQRAHGSSTPRSTSYTSAPPTSVATARPSISWPAHGELRLFEKPFAGS